MRLLPIPNGRPKKLGKIWDMRHPVSEAIQIGMCLSNAVQRLWCRAIPALYGIWLLAMASSVASAEGASRLPTIGVLYFSNPAITKLWDLAFRDGLRALGYEEGRNVKIEARYAQGDPKRVSAIVNELVGLRVDVLFVSSRILPAAMKATKTIPIVCPEMGDPVRDRIVESLARPGGNITGGYDLTSEAAAKRVELAVEIVPKLSNVGVLFDATDRSVVADANRVKELAQSRGLSTTLHGVRSRDEIEAAVKRIDRGRSQALIVLDTPLMELHQQLIISKTRYKVAVVSDGRDWAKDGALFAYAPNSYESWRRGASQVDRILKGAKPGDLPIEQATKFELVINLRTAKALGVTIPESVLLRADEIVR